MAMLNNQRVLVKKTISQTPWDLLSPDLFHRARFKIPKKSWKTPLERYRIYPMTFRLGKVLKRIMSTEDLTSCTSLRRIHPQIFLDPHNVQSLSVTSWYRERYRDSKLTQLLRNCLGGNARTVASWNAWNCRWNPWGGWDVELCLPAFWYITYLKLVVMWSCCMLLLILTAWLNWLYFRDCLEKTFLTVDSDTIMLFSSWQSDLPISSVESVWTWAIQDHGNHSIWLWLT